MLSHRRRRAIVAERPSSLPWAPPRPAAGPRGAAAVASLRPRRRRWLAGCWILRAILKVLCFPPARSARNSLLGPIPFWARRQQQQPAGRRLISCWLPRSSAAACLGQLPPPLVLAGSGGTGAGYQHPPAVAGSQRRGWGNAGAVVAVVGGPGGSLPAVVVGSRLAAGRLPSARVVGSAQVIAQK
jgi:hypothetical protein